jgi:hypothetical protein
MSTLAVEKEIALTLALSHQNGRGDFSIQGASDMNPSPACGRGKGEGLVAVQHGISKEHRTNTKL